MKLIKRILYPVRLLILMSRFPKAKKEHIINFLQMRYPSECFKDVELKKLRAMYNYEQWRLINGNISPLRF